MKYERMGGMWRACVAWKWLVGGCSGMWTDIGMFPQRHFQNLSNSADDFRSRRKGLVKREHIIRSIRSLISYGLMLWNQGHIAGYLNAATWTLGGSRNAAPRKKKSRNKGNPSRMVKSMTRYANRIVPCASSCWLSCREPSRSENIRPKGR